MTPTSCIRNRHCRQNATALHGHRARKHHEKSILCSCRQCLASSSQSAMNILERDSYRSMAPLNIACCIHVSASTSRSGRNVERPQYALLYRAFQLTRRSLCGSRYSVKRFQCEASSYHQTGSATPHVDCCHFWALIVRLMLNIYGLDIQIKATDQRPFSIRVCHLKAIYPLVLVGPV